MAGFVGQVVVVEPKDRDENPISAALPEAGHQLRGRVSSSQLLSPQGPGLRSRARGQTYSGGRAREGLLRLDGFERIG